MAARSGIALGKSVPLSGTDTGKHAGTPDDLESWLWDERPPYTAKHAAQD